MATYYTMRSTSSGAGHAPRGFYPILNAGELAILYCFVFLYLAFAGGGPRSADAILRKKA